MSSQNTLNTVIDVAKSVREMVLREAAETAEGGIPDNEPGEYARGRLGARDAILELLK